MFDQALHEPSHVRYDIPVALVLVKLNWLPVVTHVPIPLRWLLEIEERVLTGAFRVLSIINEELSVRVLSR